MPERPDLAGDSSLAGIIALLGFVLVATTQVTYPLAHPELGTLEIFIGPIGPMDGGNGYQAVFT
jgi:hypothetical protein